MAINIKALNEIGGFIAACLVDSETGLMMASEGSGSFDIESAAAANTEVVKAKLNAISLLKLNDSIEDILITLGKQYHIIRPMARKEGLFIYLVLDKAKSNLAMARRKVQDVEKDLMV